MAEVAVDRFQWPAATVTLIAIGKRARSNPELGRVADSRQKL